MRVGALSDSNAAKYDPLPFLANERHFSVPHLHKTTRVTKHRKDGLKPTFRPRDPQAAHYEYSQLMNPLHPTQHMEAFGRQMEAAVAPQPSKTYMQVVEAFRAKHPSFRDLRDESAYFLEALNIDPEDERLPRFIDARGHVLHMAMATSTPHGLYERLMRNETEVELAKRYQKASDDAMSFVQPSPNSPASSRDRSPPRELTGERRSAAPERSNLVSPLPFGDEVPHLQRLPEYEKKPSMRRGDDRGIMRRASQSPIRGILRFVTRAQTGPAAEPQTAPAAVPQTEL